MFNFWRIDNKWKNMNARVDMYTILQMETLTMVWNLELPGKTFPKNGYAPFAVLPRKILKNWMTKLKGVEPCINPLK
jgi:hypothetical protein